MIELCVVATLYPCALQGAFPPPPPPPFLAPTDSLSSGLGVPPARGAAANPQNPCKELPAAAASMNPTMLLHQMHPGVKFASEASQRDKKPYYVLTAEINGKTFTGEGFAMKKAKGSSI